MIRLITSLITAAGLCGFVSIFVAAKLEKEPSTGLADAPCAITPCQKKIDGFPAPLEDLQSMRDRKDIHAIRLHAWRLLGQLTSDAAKQPGQMPVWETDETNWLTKCALDLNQLCSPATNPSIAAPQKRLSPTGSPQINSPQGQQMSTVYFSLDAANWISKNHLENGAALQKILTVRDGIISAQDDAIAPVVPEMPSTGIVIKEIWEGFNPENARVWAYGPSVKTNPDGGLGLIAGWGAAAWLYIKTDAQNQVDENTDCTGRDYAGTEADPVPIKCFPYKKSNGRCDSLVTLQPFAASPLVAPQPVTKEDCYVVMVGFHIATRELKNWTWSTFWWVNRPSLSPDMSDMPPDLKLPAGYQHFSMDAMLSPDTPNQADLIQGFKADRPVFNPYLEGAPAKGTTSNCLSCHAVARYQPFCVVGVDANCNSQRNGSTIAGSLFDTAPKPCAKNGVDRLKQPNACELTTSFLWSLADNQDFQGVHPSMLASPIKIPGK